MSRTYHTLPFKFDPYWKERDDRHERIYYDRYFTNYWTGKREVTKSLFLLEKRGVLKKKKKNHYERQWMTTPMAWWRRHYRADRRENNTWNHEITRVDIDDLDDYDPPNMGPRDKPYYW